MADKLRAAVAIEVYPVGEPGMVGLIIRNTGQETLEPHEVIRLLKSAIQLIEENSEIIT